MHRRFEAFEVRKLLKILQTICDLGTSQLGNSQERTGDAVRFISNEHSRACCSGACNARNQKARNEKHIGAATRVSIP